MPATVTDSPNTNQLRKAAVLLLALGEDSSASILRNLPGELVRKVGAEVAAIHSVAPGEVAAVLEEFQGIVAASSGTRRGGATYARKMLANALGQDEGEKLFRKLSSESSARLDMAEIQLLQDTDPRQVARLLQEEHPQTIVLVLAQLLPERAAAVFAALPETARNEVAVRIPKLGAVAADVIQVVVRGLARTLEKQGQIHRRTHQGVKTMADLLNRLYPEMSEQVLQNLQSDNEALADSVRQLLFIFEDLVLLDDAAIRELISRVDRRLLGVALKGTSAELQRYIFSTMSQRGADMFREDMESMGPVRVKDVQEAQQQVLAVLRQLEAEGVISLRGGGESQYVV